VAVQKPLCVWCGQALPTPLPQRCDKCGLNPQPGEDLTKGGKVDPKQMRATKRSRRSAPISRKLGTKPLGRPVCGVDPGARFTGVVVRDGDVVLHATTLVRPKNMNATDWAVQVIRDVQAIVATFATAPPIAVEGVNDPKGFHHGKRAAINPKDIIRAGIVLGAVVATWPDAPVIAPGGNGSQHYSHYPADLIGRRPKELPGSTNSAGTRDHEQSAYDVAGKAARTLYPPKKLHIK
jgi:hypothetical protein